MKKSIGLPSLKGKTPKEKAKTEQSSLQKFYVPLSLSPEEALERVKAFFKISKK